MTRLTTAELERLRALSETAARHEADPVALVPADASTPRRELAAFLAAGLAFGNVAAITRSVRQVLGSLDDPNALERAGHRWVRGADIRATVAVIEALQRTHGSLGQVFAQGYVPGDMRSSLMAFCDRLRVGLPDSRGARFLAVSPGSGSACKRMNLFLRWMVRDEGFDLGLWPHVSATDLIMPLDVHVVRFATRYGLTRRRSTDWRMAEEVTAGLRRFAPEDPLRYDFAISHYGMTHGW